MKLLMKPTTPFLVFVATVLIAGHPTACAQETTPERHEKKMEAYRALIDEARGLSIDLAVKRDQIERN